MDISIKGVLLVLVVAFGLAALFLFENRGTVPGNPRIEAEFRRETGCQADAVRRCTAGDRACTRRAVSDCVRYISAD